MMSTPTTLAAILPMLPYHVTPITRAEDGTILRGRPGSPVDDATTAVVVPDAGWRTERQRAQLWLLADWRVSSVSGGSIWLLRK